MKGFSKSRNIYPKYIFADIVERKRIWESVTVEMICFLSSLCAYSFHKKKFYLGINLYLYFCLWVGSLLFVSLYHAVHIYFSNHYINLYKNYTGVCMRVCITSLAVADSASIFIASFFFLLISLPLANIMVLSISNAFILRLTLFTLVCLSLFQWQFLLEIW